MKFIVNLDLPPGVTSAQAARYLRTAVRGWGGGCSREDWRQTFAKRATVRAVPASADLSSTLPPVRLSWDR